MGSVVKAILEYHEPFWRDQGASGEVVSANDDVTVTFDDSPADGSRGTIVALVAGRAARRTASWTREERRQMLVSNLAKRFGPAARDPETYVEKVWSEDRWSAGCYTSVLPPGALTGFGEAIREPVGRIHWAGTETATRWCGYMDGAVRSGERAAAELIDRLGT